MPHTLLAWEAAARARAIAEGAPAFQERDDAPDESGADFLDSAASAAPPSPPGFGQKVEDIDPEDFQIPRPPMPASIAAALAFVKAELAKENAVRVFADEGYNRNPEEDLGFVTTLRDDTLLIVNDDRLVQLTFSWTSFHLDINTSGSGGPKTYKECRFVSNDGKALVSDTNYM